MTSFYLFASLWGIVCTYNLFYPRTSNAKLGIFSFVIGVITGELAIFLLPLQILCTLLFVLAGVVDGFWTGFILVLSLISWCAQLIYIINSSRSALLLRAELDQAGIDPPSLSADKQQAQFWSRVRKPFSIRLANVVCQKGIIYQTIDSQPQALDIYHSKNTIGAHNAEQNHAAPVLMYIHGGGLMEYGGTRVGQGLPLLNELASRGWVCVSIDYRLSPKNKWPAHLIDCKTALQWIRDNIEQYGGNPNFVVTAGDSAGGQLSALMALTANQEQFQSNDGDSYTASQDGAVKQDSRVQGAICFYGVMDFCNLYGTSHNQDAAKMWAEQVIDADLTDPANLSKFQSASPLAQAIGHKDPQSIPDCLLVHGDCDSLVALKESQLLAEKIRQVSDKQVICANVPGAQHAYNVFRSVRSELVLPEVVRFAETLHRRYRESNKHVRSAD